ncbi:adenylate/guanylate cyclase domain-containing protein [Caenimonas koreensis]|uniref:FHA domain-containing protein n=1 Tax=Caenimonas koreensis DSM 17982 TaxID=1121255 RepID=A0A844BDL1_9BURK|nr:adenylate/guanylate cyclase domain-containing protein [Caenimonas koreensis]MRD49636.1 FHA domain-containing protein [Caenimonas koreensis DSM 17982]
MTGSKTTVVFADLSGSTGVFEALGNELATKAVTSLTYWMGTVCTQHGGRVIKMLGDGVLALFPDGVTAVDAAVAMQRTHAERLREWPSQARMRLQIGVAAGEVVEVDGDCYGDSVNVAARLSDLSGADQIWTTESVVRQCENPRAGVRFLSLGAVPIRGKSGPAAMHRVEWQQDVHTTHLTVPAAPLHRIQPVQPTAGGIELSWLDQQLRFGINKLPIHLGRDAQAQFMVNDQRVSRLHASISWRQGNFVLTDLSSYGTWVRFGGNTTELALRRDDCVLADSGDIALGAPFDDFTAPTISFRTRAGQ